MNTTAETKSATAPVRADALRLGQRVNLLHTHGLLGTVVWVQTGGARIAWDGWFTEFSHRIDGAVFVVVSVKEMV